ncbi:MAG: SAM-dependent methyltransferase [Oleiphilus sp.]|nr:MAG: SAM-dependent methyltransferase [Oleiphilus sp.]
MATSITPYKASQNRLFSWHSFARKLVFGQLEKLHCGRLTIHDGDAEFSFGPGGEGLNAVMHIHDAQTFSTILTGGSIGAAEAYMTGDWSSPDLSTLVRVMVRNMDILDQMEGGLANLTRPVLKLFHRFNQNTEKGSRRNIAAHYDLGNDFFQLFLDPSMMYSSGIFPHAKATMEEASFHKLERICQRLDLRPTDHVIEIGTGWGGFAIHAAKHYGCKVTTTTISDQQYALACERVEEAGLTERITLLKQDYRALQGQFDKLVSIEMIEAVGWQYYGTFFDTCARLLKDDGAMLIQAITIQDQRYEQARRNVDFIQRYIFPGSCIPSIQALMSASMNASDLRLVQQEDFAGHYARTLHAWFDAFKANESEIAALGYDDTFRRMWEFYLCYCEGGFAERAIGVSHLVYAKPQYQNGPQSLAGQ